MRLDDIRQHLLKRTPETLEATPDAGWASVALIFREMPRGTELLLIERSHREGDPWSGHMAFPGGRRAPADPTLAATAARETFEEVGLDLAAGGQLVGQLSDLQAIGRGLRLPLFIRPYLFSVPADVALVTNHEVASTHWIPFSFFQEPANQGVWHHPYQGQEVEFPAWFWEGHVIWGLTFRMIQSLLEVLD